MNKFRIMAVSTIMLALVAVSGYSAYSQFADPCAVFPHQTAFIPFGTPTAALVVGVANKSIYVCSVNVESIVAPGGTPITETFFSGGEANASATPCATATAGGPAAVATVGIISVASGVANFGGDGTRTLYLIPTVTSGFPIDFCGLMSGGTGIKGSITYVQR
jgi:hypothetical protein